MAVSRNSKLLVVAASLLGVIKFALLPVIAWQNQTIEQIQQIEARNEKSQRLLQQEPDLIKGLQQSNESYAALVDTYPSFADSPSFRLETQINFEALLKSANLRQKKFFWRSEQDEKVIGSLYSAKFNVNFSGKAKDFAILHAQLAKSQRQFMIQNMSIPMRRQTPDSLGSVNGSLTIKALYWQGGAQ